MRLCSLLPAACKACYSKLVKRGFTAELVRLDNEISVDLAETIESDGLDCQLAPPGDHRQNPAEGAIKHSKACFKSIRACTDPNFDKRD